MFKKFPWLNSRKKLLIFIFSDLIIYFILSISLNLPLILLFQFLICWIPVSYVIGRYTFKRESRVLYSFKYLFKNFSLFIFFITINTSLNYFNSDYLLLNNLLLSFILIETSLTISIRLILFNKITSKNYYLFFVDNDEFLSCKKLITNSNSIIKIVNYDNKLDLNKNFLQGVVYNENRLIEDEKKEIIKNLNSEGVKIYNLMDWFELELQTFPVDFIETNPFSSKKFILPNKEIELRVKFLSENLLAVFLLIISFPLIIISALLIYFEDNGPIFYSQERDGINGKKIQIFKLRTMKINAEKSGVQWSIKNDKRVTKVGSILRKIRIDELPQLISVLKGDMNLIGPRPERRFFNNCLEKEIPFYNLRHQINPGISGWAQVNYCYGSSIEDSKIKLGYDLYYIKNFSNLLDILILFKTIRLVFNAKGAVKQND